ncbi:hypothetical protein P280DRAFT_145883 [Massarina eburnea CBS 473.64]|uniref:Uncharacterized protein n=1 Tax=Massarina eburnea CBS 473.64 TaxID=1395130 RepID=A0A6A6RN75_9PLEO|nr:hypothetical protein P280DRAFT_145883 [Massarina eburnea CBS 473.64]
MDESAILVHVAAPATKKNDDIYHSLAEEYAQFEPHVVHGAHSSALATMSRSTYGSFPSNINSGDHFGGLDHDQSSTEEDSEGDDDQPVSRIQQLECIHAKWKEQNPSRVGAGASTSMSSTNWGDAFIDDTQLAYRAMESQVLDVESQAVDEESSSSLGATPSPTLLNPTMAVATVAAYPMLSMLPPVTWTPTPKSTAKSTYKNPQNELDVSYSSTTLQEANEENAALVDLSHLPFEVLPPAPKVGVDTPSRLPSQITKSLHILKQQNPGKFTPSRKIRALEPDERGHWLVDTSTWPSKTQVEFWTSISDYIQSGRLGWGVSLFRDSARQLGTVRLFCWGEIVEHIWLALWLCSQGTIVKSGSSWLDAEEIVMIEA